MVQRELSAQDIVSGRQLSDSRTQHWVLSFRDGATIGDHSYSRISVIVTAFSSWSSRSAPLVRSLLGDDFIRARMLEVLFVVQSYYYIDIISYEISFGSVALCFIHSAVFPSSGRRSLSRIVRARCRDQLLLVILCLWSTA